MTTSTRNTISAATLFGLVSFITSSAIFSGLFATPTLVAFSLLAVYGLIEIAAISYATPQVHISRVIPAPAKPVVAVRRVPAVIEYPVFRRPATRALAA